MRDNTEARPKELPTLDPDAGEARSPTLGFGYSLGKYYDSISEIGIYDHYDRIPSPVRDCEEWWYFCDGEVVCYREISGYRKWEDVGGYEKHVGRKPTNDHLAYILFVGALRDW